KCKKQLFANCGEIKEKAWRDETKIFNRMILKRLWRSIAKCRLIIKQFSRNIPQTIPERF
ncbi:hypothetical protein, partial [Enterobacter hormaechei]|uniref:hypothetical protein n=1 Tax=Enterobacter hormaechei TaxID=158836 RepID=UPI00254EA4E4